LKENQAEIVKNKSSSNCITVKIDSNSPATAQPLVDRTNTNKEMA
jgi:hypothetical protein